MCGIVGLYFKNATMEQQLGELFRPMLISMTERGCDSAGFAVYGDEYDAGIKLTLRAVMTPASTGMALPTASLPTLAT